MIVIAILAASMMTVFSVARPEHVAVAAQETERVVVLAEEGLRRSAAVPRCRSTRARHSRTSPLELPLRRLCLAPMGERGG